MRKLDRGTTGSALVALLLACAGLGALAAAPASASRGCPQAALKPHPAPRDIAHPPAREVVACVGTTPITGARWARWFAISRHGFKHPDAQDVLFEALVSLTQFASVEGEARERHLVVTAKAVQHSFEHILRTRFRRPGSFRRFLRATGQRTADFLAGVRNDLLIEALHRHETATELDAFDAKWQARTTCSRALADGNLCGLIAPFAAGLPSVGVRFGADAIAVDPVSDTVYVGSLGGLTLIDGKTCNAAVTSGCAPGRKVSLSGADVRAIAIDPATDTIYLSEGDSAVAVLDARTCNATVPRCDHGTLVKLGHRLVPEQPLLDPATHTLYTLDDGDRTISVIDVAHCNALDRSGCGKAPARLQTADEFPQAIAVDSATGTLYVANEDGSTVSLVDTRTCSALNASRCVATAPTLKLPGIANPLALAVDASTNALYVASDENELFALDGATCNATVRSGCVHLRTVQLRASGGEIALDAVTHTAYVAARFLGGAELVDVGACNPANGAGCGRTPRLARTGSEPGDGLAIDARTRTVYVTNSDEDSLSLIRMDRCNATTTAGC